MGSGEVGDVNVDVDSTCDWGEEVTSDSSAVTFDSSADIMLCATACFASNKEDSSTADSSWLVDGGACRGRGRRCRFRLCGWL